MKPVIVVSTYPNLRSLKKTARLAVEGRLAACVNIARISSVYSWKGDIVDSPEYIALFKTTARNKRSLKRVIQENHPYDVPEIAEIGVSSLNAPYLKWLQDSTL